MKDYLWKRDFDSVLDVPLEYLGMCSRTDRCLSNLGVKTIGDLLRKKSDDLLNVKGFGHTSLAQLRLNLKEDIGIAFW